MWDQMAFRKKEKRGAYNFMTKTIMHPVYGAVSYDESIWTGKRTLAINGKILKKGKKNVYILQEGEASLTATLKGNLMTGVSVIIEGTEITIIPKTTGLEWILSVLPFALVMIWGSVPALCAIIPVVGGAIGGAISAVAMVYCACNIKGKTLGQKVLMSLLATVIAFAVCAAIGYILVLGMIASSM